MKCTDCWMNGYCPDRHKSNRKSKYIYYINTIREKISLWLAVFGISALFCIPITFTACQIETGNAFLYSKDYLIVCFYAILLIFIGLIFYPQSKFKISINECITKKKCKEKNDLYVADSYGDFTKIGEITRRKARDKFLTEQQK